LEDDMNEGIKAAEVASWVAQVLTGYDGLYDVQDQLFVRQTVRVVTKRRDSYFDISSDRWKAAADPEALEALGHDLGLWARRVFPASHA
jgi:Txe/YoeB family toxin of Txe-Axe toxin-antitoxin module